MERNLGQGWREEKRLGKIKTFRRDKQLPPPFLIYWLQHQGFGVQISGDKEAVGRKSFSSECGKCALHALGFFTFST